ncbi:MAG: multidrug efflux MFS transporter [Clostridia bacterium]|nr:multidrug efflux MFS transporter [Clostridia bacterium]
MAEKFKLTKKMFISLVVVIIGSFMSSLSSTIVTPALPSIISTFDITAADAGWLTTVYLLVMGIMVPVTAYLITRFSTKLLFCISMVCFAVGTALAAISPAFWVLIAGRVVQSLGSGILVPLVTTMILWMFPKERRGGAMGTIGLIVGAAPIVGPALSGWMTDMWGWRSIFAAIIPIAVIDIVLALFFLENQTTPRKASLDKLSLLLSTVGFFAVLYAFGSVSNMGWTNPIVIICTIVGVIAVIAMFRRQTRLSEPFLDVRTLKSVPFLIGTILSMIVFAALLFAGVLIPIFLQNVSGYSATQSGLIQVPGAAVMAAMNPISGIILDKKGPRGLSIAGFTFMVIGTIFFVVCTPQTHVALICTMFSLRAVGIAFILMPLTTWGMNSLENKVLAHATAINNTLRQVAGSLGTAVFVTVYSISTQNSMALGPIDAQMHGFHVAFLSSMILMIVGLVLCLIFVKDNRGKKKLPAGERAGALPDADKTALPEGEKS